jgi:hypothetical protein
MRWIILERAGLLSIRLIVIESGGQIRPPFLSPADLSLTFRSEIEEVGFPKAALPPADLSLTFRSEIQATPAEPGDVKLLVDEKFAVRRHFEETSRRHEATPRPSALVGAQQRRGVEARAEGAPG